MAKIELAAHLKAASGSFGGVVHTRNCGGNTIRPRRAPTDPKTARQQQIRRVTAELAQMWRTLSSQQRAAWNEFARTQERLNRVADTVTPSGISLFTGVNHTLADVGAPYVFTPPLYCAPASPIARARAALTVRPTDPPTDDAPLVVREPNEAQNQVVRGSPDPALPPTEGLPASAPIPPSTHSPIPPPSLRITTFALWVELFGNAALQPHEKLYVRATPPVSAGRSLNVVMRQQTAINAGAPYTALDIDLFHDYTARHGDSFGTCQQIGLSIKIVNTATGASTPYYQLLVAP